MPRIPDVSALGARSTPNVLQPIPQATGDASARALQGLGKTITQVSDDLYRSDAEAQLTEARNALNDFEAKLHDPETGLASKQGKDAFDLTKTVPEKFDEYAGKVVNGITNKKARELASELALNRRAQIESTVGDYVSRQRDDYENGQYKAGMESSIGRVAANPTTLDTELQYQRNATTARLAKKGASPEETDQSVKNLHTATYGAVVDGMIGRGQYEEARKFFDKNAASFGDKSDEYGRRTLAAIEHQQLVQERQRAEAERNVRVKASQLLEASDPTQPVDAVLKDLSVSIDQQPGLREQLESRQKARLQGLAVQSDPREVDRLRTLMGRDPAAFQKTDITLSYPKLSVQDRDYFEKSQHEIGDPNKQAQFATEAQLLSDSHDRMKIPEGNKGQDLRGLFDTQYRAEREAFVKQNNRVPNAEETQGIIRRLELPFTQAHPYWFDTTAPLFKLDAANGTALEVPAADRATIVARNAANGKPALTEDQIRQAYVLWKGQ